MPDGAAARRDDEQIAGGPPGSLRRDCDGVRAPDRRRGGGSAAGWRDVAAWTSGRGKGGAEDRCETAGEISAPGVPPTRMAAGGRRRGRAARGERARPAAKDKAVGRPRRSASRTTGRRGMSPWTNSGEGERTRDAAGIRDPRRRPREDVAVDERRGGGSAVAAADDAVGLPRRSASRMDGHEGMSPRTSGGTGEQPRDGRGNQCPAQTAVGDVTKDERRGDETYSWMGGGV